MIGRETIKHYAVLALIFFSSTAIAQTDKTDWANLERFKEENMELQPPSKGEHRIVFMGNSITKGWLSADSFFQKHTQYINRGIGGQTTPQMLVRFRQDVIQLSPSAVVILAGINDIAQNM